MIQFTTALKQFGEKGEKTGWTYLEVPIDLAQKLKPDNKKSFRVKGKLDDLAIKSVALIPMGGGKFIMAVNAAMRKGIGKRKGAMLKVQLEVDNKKLELSKELMECLVDEPKSLTFFKTLPPSHQHYFSKWIEDAKTEQTKTKRIAQAVNALSKNLNFGLMLRALKENKDEEMF
ncbi:MAG TPA: YdeI/OmpD-associated family protein [Puia sp.]|jgi:hypothetical protein|nr:YdeI/OmpD-associated family protein [Puia sp.]